MRNPSRFLLIAFLSLMFCFVFPALGSIQINTPINISMQTSVESLVQTGKKYYDSGNFLASVQNLRKAAKIYNSQGDLLKQAQVLSFISLAEYKLSNFQEASTAINNSFSILNSLEKDSNNSENIERVRAQILNAQGHLHLAKGNAQAAWSYWRDGEKVYRKINNIEGVIGSQINQAQALRTLGLYRQTYNLLTQIEQEIDNLEDSPLKVIGLQNIGNILREKGELERSEKLLKLSLELIDKLINSKKYDSQNLLEYKGKILLNIANTEFTLFKNLESIGDKEAAERHIHKAIKYYQQSTDNARFLITKVQARLNKFRILIDVREFELAQSLILSIQDNLQELTVSRNSIYAQVNFTDNWMKLDKYADSNKSNNQSIDHQRINQILKTAIAQARKLEDRRAEAYGLETLGKLYERIGDLSAAKITTQSALIIAQGINAPDISYRLQWQMGRILQAQSQDKISSDAISYYQSAFNNLNSLRSDLASLNPEIQYSFREEVEPVYRQLVDLLLRSSQSNKENLIKARDVIEALQLAELDNFFRDACAKPIEASIDNLDSSAAIVYPIILENRLEVIAKLPGEKNLYHFSNSNISKTQMDAAVQNMRSQLVKPSTSIGKIKKSSQELYNWLIKPMEAELEKTAVRENSNIKTLVFVLDGSLQNLPMSLLYDGEKYLVERYAVAVTPGLQLIAPSPFKSQKIKALIAGTTNSPSFKKENLAPLENVKIELLEVSKKIPENSKLENKDFLKENIQKKIESDNYNVVHIATHGQFSSNPEQTFILDWNKRIKVKEWDTLIQPKDLKEETPVELLVLSACETAKGDNRAALGLAGVAIRAGARSTLATLWQVNDASIAEFMNQFYKQLNNPNITKVEALRNAQLSFLKDYPDTDYNRPYHWAPFSLVGNWL